MRVILCALAVCVVGAYGGSLPSFIQPCSASDPKLNQCVEKVAALAIPKFCEGIPELGIAPLDPMKIDKLDINNDLLKMSFDDISVTGLKGSRVNSVKINPAKGKATMDFTANVTMTAHYVMDGQILILPVKGDGQAKIKITNLNIVVKYDFLTENGYWAVPSYKQSYKMDRAQFKFENLFGGNKELATTTEQFANENWAFIMQDLGPSVMKSIIRQCIEEVRKLYDAIPANQLMTP